jgi:hypothetical protein
LNQEFDELYRQHHQLIYRTALAVTGSSDDAAYPHGQDGIQGLFNLDLHFAVDSGPVAPTDTTTPDIFGAIQELGIKLEPATARLPVVIIDSIQKPSEN